MSWPANALAYSSPSSQTANGRTAGKGQPWSRSAPLADGDIAPPLGHITADAFLPLCDLSRAYCCALGEKCVTWQWREDRGCRVGGPVRLGLERTGTPGKRHTQCQCSHDNQMMRTYHVHYRWLPTVRRFIFS